jgi:hypothetical protein
MSTLYVTFIPPSPVPSQYKIRYKQTTDPSYTEVIYPSTGLSPEEFSITGVTSGVNYNVEVQSYCGRGVYAAGFPVISTPDDCQTYFFGNTDAVSTFDVEYVLCGSTTLVIEAIAPLANVSRCCSNTTPPVSYDPEINITPGVPCTP